MQFKINSLWVIKCLVIAYFACLVIFHTQNQKYVTNPERSDGFGAQYQTIIYAAIYAELNHLDFIYTPFKTMEHNYNNDPDFLDKKENLINIINYFEPVNQQLFVKKFGANDYINFFENNIEQAMQAKVLQEIKSRFRANKPNNYFNNDAINIAVHIRRPNAHDHRLAGADVPDQTFAKIINYLKDKYKNEEYLIHIYSQGNAANFKAFADPRVVLHLNEPVEDTFTGLALADVLVMSPSSFSYTAGLISEGEVYYLRFWHKPAPGWHIVQVENDRISICIET